MRRRQRAMPTLTARAVGQADRQSTVWRLNGQRTGVFPSDCAWLPSQKVSGERAISERFCLKVRREWQITCRSKKNRRFFGSLPPALPFDAAEGDRCRFGGLILFLWKIRRCIAERLRVATRRSCRPH